MKIQYDKTKKKYLLNGLELTYQEMLSSFIHTYPMLFNDSWQYSAELSDIRTNIKPFGLMSWHAKNTNQAFRECPNLEVVDMRPYDFPSHFTRVSKFFSIFYKCPKLRAVYGFNLESTTHKNDMRSAFVGCSNLTDVVLQNLKYDISFGDSPLLTKTSVLFLINKAAPAEALTITLHPDAYSRLIADQDIIDALAKQPLISLAEETV